MSKKPTLDRSSIAAWLRARWPTAEGFRPHDEGMESQVFAFLAEGKRYILRLNASDEGFRKDKRCYAWFADALPIPRVIELGAIEHAFYCISEFVEGTTVEDLSADDLPGYVPVVYQLWDRITGMDTTRFRGFGVLDIDGRAPHRSWNDYLRGFYSEAAIAPIRNASTADQRRTLETAVARYRDLVERCPEERSLFHGDFGSNNVLVRDGKIAGIIDWDRAGIGDRLTDVAGAYFWTHHLECMRQQALYFADMLGSLPNYDDRIACYQLKIGMEELRENVEDGSTGDKIDWLFSRLSTILESSATG